MIEMQVTDKFPKGFYKMSRDEQAQIVKEKRESLNAIENLLRKLSQQLAGNKKIDFIDMDGRPDLELMKDDNG
jgi:hypothetical protein